MAKKNKHSHKLHRARHNPLGEPTGKFLRIAVAGIVGGFGARAIPENFASKYNTGVAGYFLNLLVALGGGWGLVKLGLGNEIGFGFGLGGTITTGDRILSDLFGKTVIAGLLVGKGANASQVPAAVPADAVAPGAPGLSGLGRFGDPSHSLGKYVKPYNYPIPVDPRSAGAGSTALVASSKSRQLSRFAPNIM